MIDDQGNLSIVVDLRHLAFIDANGLAALADARGRLRTKHSQLTLRSVPSNAGRVLEFSGLLPAFELIDAVDDATSRQHIDDVRDVPAMSARGG